MADITAIAPLANIVIVDADLVEVRSDVSDKYLNTTSGQSDFTKQIADAKRVLHVEIQTRDGLTDAQMLLVKDTELSTMKYKIVRRALANIMIDSDLDIAADMYNKQADRMATKYVLDADEDNEQSASEVALSAGPRFSR